MTTKRIDLFVTRSIEEQFCFCFGGVVLLLMLIFIHSQQPHTNFQVLSLVFVSFFRHQLVWRSFILGYPHIA